jgi:tetratricopeptide (TPR) repeat protein
MNDAPTEGSYVFGCATAYDNKGDLDNAIKLYDKAIAMTGGKDKTWKDTLKSAKQRKAQPLVDEAFKKQTASPPDLKGAIESYEAALKLDPDNAGTHSNLGTAYQGMTPPNNAKAIEHYKKAVALDPNQFDTYYYLGTAYEGINQPALAIQAYKTYVAKQPNGGNAAACKDRLKILHAK